MKYAKLVGLTLCSLLGFSSLVLGSQPLKEITNWEKVATGRDTSAMPLMIFQVKQDKDQIVTFLGDGNDSNNDIIFTEKNTRDFFTTVNQIDPNTEESTCLLFNVSTDPDPIAAYVTPQAILAYHGLQMKKQETIQAEEQKEALEKLKKKYTKKMDEQTDALQQEKQNRLNDLQIQQQQHKQELLRLSSTILQDIQNYVENMAQREKATQDLFSKAQKTYENSTITVTAIDKTGTMSSSIIVADELVISKDGVVIVFTENTNKHAEFLVLTEKDLKAVQQLKDNQLIQIEVKDDNSGNSNPQTIVFNVPQDQINDLRTNASTLKPDATTTSLFQQFQNAVRAHKMVAFGGLFATIVALLMYKFDLGFGEILTAFSK